MLFKNLKTNMVWAVENNDRILELQNSSDYEVVEAKEETKPTKKSSKKRTR